MVLVVAWIVSEAAVPGFEYNSKYDFFAYRHVLVDKIILFLSLTTQTSLN